MSRTAPVAATVQSKVDGCRVEKCLTARNEASLSLCAVAMVWFADRGRISVVGQSPLISVSQLFMSERSGPAQQGGGRL